MELKGVIKKIDRNRQADGRIFFGVDAPGKFHRKNGLILCLGDAGLIRFHMTVAIEGEDKGGYIDCRTITPVYLTDETTLSYLTTITKGLNIKKGALKKIVSFAGKNIFTMGSLSLEELLLDHSEDLKLGAYKIRQFCEKIYSDNTVRLALEDLLKEANVEDIAKRKKLVNVLYSEYGDEAITEIKSNPYKTLEDTDVSIIGIEKLAKKYGIVPWSKTRVIGLMRYAILQEMNAGHTYVDAKVVSKTVRDLSKNFPYYSEIPEIVMSNTLIHDKEIVFCEDKPYQMALSKVCNEEKAIAKSLKNLLNVKTDRVIEIAEENLKLAESLTGFSYGTDQKKAFRLLESSAIAILTGGPGTGKTALINGIVSLYRKFYPEDIIKFAAPTGRAAKRLSESVGDDAATIHRLIEYIPYKKHTVAARNKVNPIEANLIIIDESSMIDTELMAMLLDAIKVVPQVKIIFVGDKDQLPSVGYGSVFADMIESKLFPVYQLKENFRQDGKGSIVDNAKRIGDGLLPEEKDDFRMTKVNSEKEAMDAISSLMKEMYQTCFPYETQVIEPMRSNFSGCAKVNEMVHRDVVFRDKNITEEIQPGDKIMFTRNEYTRVASENGDIAKDIIPLYTNGDMGIVEKIAEDYILVDMCGEEVEVPLYAKNDMELAYACTVHKFQGSEAENIIINLPLSAKRMLTRSFLYTAVTRARKNVIIIYEGNALETCVSNKNAVKRRTKLKTLLTA